MTYTKASYNLKTAPLFGELHSRLHKIATDRSLTLDQRYDFLLRSAADVDVSTLSANDLTGAKAHLEQIRQNRNEGYFSTAAFKNRKDAKEILATVDAYISTLGGKLEAASYSPAQKIVPSIVQTGPSSIDTVVAQPVEPTLQLVGTEQTQAHAPRSYDRGVVSRLTNAVVKYAPRIAAVVGIAAITLGMNGSCSKKDDAPKYTTQVTPIKTETIQSKETTQKELPVTNIASSIDGQRPLVLLAQSSESWNPLAPIYPSDVDNNGLLPVAPIIPNFTITQSATVTQPDVQEETVSTATTPNTTSQSQTVDDFPSTTLCLKGAFADRVAKGDFVVLKDPKTGKHTLKPVDLTKAQAGVGIEVNGKPVVYISNQLSHTVNQMKDTQRALDAATAYFFANAPESVFVQKAELNQKARTFDYTSTPNTMIELPSFNGASAQEVTDFASFISGLPAQSVQVLNTSNSLEQRLATKVQTQGNVNPHAFEMSYTAWRMGGKPIKDDAGNLTTLARVHYAMASEIETALGVQLDSAATVLDQLNAPTPITVPVTEYLGELPSATPAPADFASVGVIMGTPQQMSNLRRLSERNN